MAGLKQQAWIEKATGQQALRSRIEKLEAQVPALRDAVRKASGIGRVLAEWIRASESTVINAAGVNSYRLYVDEDSMIWNDVTDLILLEQVFAASEKPK